MFSCSFKSRSKFPSICQKTLVHFSKGRSKVHVVNDPVSSEIQIRQKSACSMISAQNAIQSFSANSPDQTDNECSHKITPSCQKCTVWKINYLWYLLTISFSSRNCLLRNTETQQWLIPLQNNHQEFTTLATSSAQFDHVSSNCCPYRTAFLTEWYVPTPVYPFALYLLEQMLQSSCMRHL